MMILTVLFENRVGELKMSWHSPEHYAPVLPRSAGGGVNVASIVENKDFTQALRKAQDALADGVLNREDIPAVDRASAELAQALSSLEAYEDVISDYRQGAGPIDGVRHALGSSEQAQTLVGDVYKLSFDSTIAPELEDAGYWPKRNLTSLSSRVAGFFPREGK